MTPDGWEVTSLDDCVPSSAPICYGILMPGQHCAGGVPVVKVRDVVDGRIDESELLFTHPSIDGAYKRSRLAEGDLLITIRGTTGRVALTPSTLNGANITQDTARVRVKGDVSNQFVYFALQSEQAQQQVALHTIGQAVKGINIRDVRRLTFPIPRNGHEQRVIAAALGDADALLAGLDRLIAKKRDLKQAAMQRLLTGRNRLSGFSREWNIRRLGQIAQLYQPETIAQTEFTEHGYPVYGANGVIGRYSRYNHAAPQITISCRGNCGTVNRTEPFAWITGNAMVVNVEGTDAVKQDFLFHVLKFMDFSDLVTGSGQPQIVRGPLREFQVALPEDLCEQAAIAKILTDMDEAIEVLCKRRQKTLALKQAMMQELLTGRIRLV